MKIILILFIFINVGCNLKVEKVGYKASELDTIKGTFETSIACPDPQKHGHIHSQRVHYIKSEKNELIELDVSMINPSSITKLKPHDRISISFPITEKKIASSSSNIKTIKALSIDKIGLRDEPLIFESKSQSQLDPLRGNHTFRIGFILVDFLNNPLQKSDEEVYDFSDDIKKMFHDSSLGRIKIKIDRDDIYRTYQNFTPTSETFCDKYGWSSTYSKALNSIKNKIPGTKLYDRMVMVVNTPPGCRWAGITYISDIDRTAGAIVTIASARVITHELGHTFGLDHAQRTFEDGGKSEYGDTSDFMGRSLSGTNAIHMAQWNYLSLLNGSMLSVDENGGNFEIINANSIIPDFQKALIYDNKYIISYRKGESGLGIDSEFVNGVSIHKISSLKDLSSNSKSNLVKVVSNGTSWESKDGLKITVNDLNTDLGIANISINENNNPGKTFSCVPQKPSIDILFDQFYLKGSNYFSTKVSKNQATIMKITITNNDKGNCLSRNFDLLLSGKGFSSPENIEFGSLSPNESFKSVYVPIKFEDSTFATFNFDIKTEPIILTKTIDLKSEDRCSNFIFLGSFFDKKFVANQNENIDILLHNNNTNEKCGLMEFSFSIIEKEFSEIILPSNFICTSEGICKIFLNPAESIKFKYSLLPKSSSFLPIIDYSIYIDNKKQILPYFKPFELKLENSFSDKFNDLSNRNLYGKNKPNTNEEIVNNDIICTGATINQQIIILFYNYFCYRCPDKAGLNYWNNLIVSKDKTLWEVRNDIKSICTNLGLPTMTNCQRQENNALYTKCPFDWKFLPPNSSSCFKTCQ